MEKAEVGQRDDGHHARPDPIMTERQEFEAINAYFKEVDPMLVPEENEGKVPQRDVELILPQESTKKAAGIQQKTLRG